VAARGALFMLRRAGQNGTVAWPAVTLGGGVAGVANVAHSGGLFYTDASTGTLPVDLSDLPHLFHLCVCVPALPCPCMHACWLLAPSGSAHAHSLALTRRLPGRASNLNNNTLGGFVPDLPTSLQYLCAPALACSGVRAIPDACRATARAPRSDLKDNAFFGGVPNEAAIAFAAGMPLLCVAVAAHLRTLHCAFCARPSSLRFLSSLLVR
jgi:hypothetical protein